MKEATAASLSSVRPLDCDEQTHRVPQRIAWLRERDVFESTHDRHHQAKTWTDLAAGPTLAGRDHRPDAADQPARGALDRRFQAYE